MDATTGLPVDGRLYGYWEQGMEAVEATLDPSGSGQSKDARSSALVRLNEGDLLSVRSPEGHEIWRGILQSRRWPFAKALPHGWERWFDLELPAVLLRRGQLPFWRLSRERPFYVTSNSDRPPSLRHP